MNFRISTLFVVFCISLVTVYAAENDFYDAYLHNDIEIFDREFKKLSLDDQSNFLETSCQQLLDSILASRFAIAEWFITNPKVDINATGYLDNTAHSILIDNIKHNVKNVETTHELMHQSIRLLTLLAQRKDFDLSNNQWNRNPLPHQIITLIHKLKKQQKKGSHQASSIITKLENLFKQVINNHPTCIHSQTTAFEEEENHSLLYHAFYEGNNTLAKEILKHPHFDMQKEKQSNVFDGVSEEILNKNPDFELIELITQNPHFDINMQAVEYDRATLLHTAAQCDKTEIVKILTKNPHLNPNIQDCRGRTPAHLAKEAPLKILLENVQNLDLLIADEHGGYPYVVNAHTGTETHEILLKKTMEQAVAKKDVETICKLIAFDKVKPTQEAINILKETIKNNPNGNVGHFSAQEVQNFIDDSFKKRLTPSENNRSGSTNRNFNRAIKNNFQEKIKPLGIGLSTIMTFYDIYRFCTKEPTPKLEQQKSEKKNIQTVETEQKKPTHKETPDQEPTGLLYSVTSYFKDITQNPTDHATLMVPFAWIVYQVATR